MYLKIVMFDEVEADTNVIPNNVQRLYIYEKINRNFPMLNNYSIMYNFNIPNNLDASDMLM